MRILLTGASSFTGYWFAKELVAAGHDVVAPLRRPLADYDAFPTRRERVRRLGAIVRLVPSAPLGGAAFLSCCEERFDALCHHAAHVDGYRDAGFDATAALASNTLNLADALRRLLRRGLKAVVLTGSVFEPDEGAGDLPLGAVSPYGLSKGLTFQAVRYWCEALGAPLAKFVIPNPFGPLEEFRFCQHLMTAWRTGRPGVVRTPLYLRDNIHVDLLARCYARFVERAVTAGGWTRFNPSGYVESQGAFARRLAGEMAPRLGVPCELECLGQTDFPEPRVRINTQPGIILAPDWSETSAWDAYAESFRAVAGEP